MDGGHVVARVIKSAYITSARAFTTQMIRRQTSQAIPRNGLLLATCADPALLFVNQCSMPAIYTHAITFRIR